MRVGMRLRGVAEPPDIVGDDAADRRPLQIGAVALRPGYPVVAGGSLERVPSLVDHDDDRVFVPRLDRRAVAFMGEPGVVGHLADPHHVGIEEMAERLHVPGERLGVVGQRRLLPESLPLVHRHLLPVDVADGGVQRVLGDETADLPGRGLAEVAVIGPNEESRALGDLLDRIRNQGGRPVHPLDLLHRVRPEMHRPLLARQDPHSPVSVLDAVRQPARIIRIRPRGRTPSGCHAARPTAFSAPADRRSRPRVARRACMAGGAGEEETVTTPSHPSAARRSGRP